MTIKAHGGPPGNRRGTGTPQSKPQAPSELGSQHGSVGEQRPSTANPAPNPAELDDLLSSLIIEGVLPRAAGGSWVTGRIDEYRFTALVFAEHAANPAWELDDSRISKLAVWRAADGAEVAAFDRGWDLEPTSPVAIDVVELLAAGLADAIASRMT